MNLETLWHQALSLYQGQNYQQAVEALNQFPPDPNVEFLKAQCLWMMGNYSASIESFKKALSLNPSEFQIHSALIKALLAENQIQKARIYLDNAEKIFGQNSFISVYKLLCEKSLINELHYDDLNELFNNHPNDPLCRNLNLALNKFQTHDKTFHPLGSADEVMKKSYNDIFQLSPDIQLLSMPKIVLQLALNSVELDGLYMEMGVYYGQSINISAKLHSHKTFYGFDSFEGLPEEWKEGEGQGSYSTNSKLPKVPENVKLIKGWFKDSLPGFLSQHSENVAFLHIDCDIYSSTKDIFQQLSCRIVKGTVILFDDFFGYQGYEDHEIKAFREFLEETGHQVEYLGFCPLGRELAVKIST